MAAEQSRPNSRILIIGCGGFIGSHLCSRLSGEGHQVVGFDLKEPDENFGATTFFTGDIRRKTDLLPALKNVDTVINLAAVHFDYGHDDAEYFDTNEHGMEVLLEAMSECGVQRLIFTSSIAIYGAMQDWADEETPPEPDTAYGASKLAAERHIHKWAEQDPERCVVVVRPCAVYGERNVSNMMNLIRQINSGYFVLFGSGRNVKATAYVGNLVDALVLQLNALAPGIQVYNYADKPDLTVAEIVTTIRQSLGKTATYVKLPLWLGVIAATPFDLYTRLTGRNLPVSQARVKKLATPTRVHADRIRQAGYRQQVSSTEGLQRMVRHFMNGHHTKNGSP